MKRACYRCDKLGAFRISWLSVHLVAPPVIVRQFTVADSQRISPEELRTLLAFCDENDAPGPYLIERDTRGNTWIHYYGSPAVLNDMKDAPRRHVRLATTRVPEVLGW